MSLVSNMTLPSHMAGFLHELGPPGGGVYSFVSRPAALLLHRPRYKNEQNGGRTVNIMHDRRVIRGNTYSVQGPPLRSNTLLHFKYHKGDQHNLIAPLPNIGNGKTGHGHHAVATLHSSIHNPQWTSSRRPYKESRSLQHHQNHSDMSIGAKYSAAKSRVRKRLCQFQSQMLNTMSNETSSKDVQTECLPHSIDNSEKYVEMHAQTDENMSHGQTILTSKAIDEIKIADVAPMVDNATQIYPQDTELFSFDEEVALLLEALVCRTIENSILEILEEDNTDQTIQYTYYLTS
ncbi:hypothetical protein TCAL_15056 [Tigriopus californicus]|uniref:Uncharacterized protein n=1 Tax=Tigriopus californicus TaxID=6832 RepID=A0A553NZ43_TIGCA|nr:hypothetical protein TCAL_15056 [Tigriopus californicus]